MKMTINIKFPAVVLLLTMLALLAYSCSDENEAAGTSIYQGERVPLGITMGARNTTDEDKVIKSVRAIVFNDKDQLVYNAVSDASINDDNTFTATIRAARGYNNIYIICNETTELTEKLNAIKRENEIENVTFSAVGIVAPPPMYGNVTHAYVESRSDGSNATVIVNNVRMTELPISVTRMISRISFTAIKNIANKDEDFKVTKLNVKVCRMPVATPIGEGQAYTEDIWSDDLTISGTGELDNNGDYIIKDNNYTIPDTLDFITIPATYIPEHLLSQPENASQATYLKIDAQCVLKNGSSQVLNCVYLLDIGQEPPKNYNLTRNNHYQIYATITGMGAMGLYAQIVAMEEHDITINWKPIDGLVIVSDKAADYDAVADTSKNVNIWNDVSVYSGILKAYHSETGYKDVLFKYGSLIAVHSGTSAGEGFIAPTASVLNDVLWYPGSYDPLSISGWTDIPYLNTDGIPANNTIDQVKAGVGDPCKLAGLSETQIKAQNIVDNGQWHMATPNENQALIAASDNKNNSYGYPSFHWLLSPHNRYRDAGGVSQGDRSNGGYWTDDASVFEFSGNPSGASFQSGKDRQSAYMIRCVRNEIPESKIEAGTISSPTYQGTEKGVKAYFGIKSNVPYWTATLVTGTGAGTADPNDFSFVSGGTIVHTTHGSNTENIPVYVKRKESASPRSFRVKVEGVGLDGQTRSILLTVSQSGYDLRATTGLSSLGNIPQTGGTYTVNIQLTPTDISIPAGELYLQVIYGGVQKCLSTKADTEPNTYSYSVSVTIPENSSPSSINLTVNILLAKDTGVTVPLGSPSITQNGY
ncbi:fimbrial protein [Bacteroides ovatus]|uniref:fimbrial protein n=1 Tax=Bacteroides ovatus TaxID=28116 RepID=UPI001C02F7D9|nr:fimbrial protein [Bacteroides ovatus]